VALRLLCYALAMGVLDVFSKRNKPLPDVFRYDHLPEALRVQLVHVLRDECFVDNPDVWTFISKGIAKEHGLLELPNQRHWGHAEACFSYVLTAGVLHVIDLLEVACRLLQRIAPAIKVIEEINHRFREHGCGYQYEDGEFMRVDSQFLHAEVVKPVLRLLNDKTFKGAEGEFLRAHEHFRHGQIEAAITEACKAFESTMKAICDTRKWHYDDSKAAANLIKTLLNNELIPQYWQEQLHALDKCLTGLATARNKNAGHGAGTLARETPPHLAAYALHLAASNIVFLIESHNAKPAKTKR